MTGFGTKVLARGLAACALLLVSISAAHPDAPAPARRAFVVGVQNYADPFIQQLRRSENDASGVAADLEQIGFDHKNITLAKGVRAKADFDKSFQAFLSTINEGDVVLFFFSGHGAGIESTHENYLLLGNLKSLHAYTRDQLLPGDRQHEDVIAVKMPSFEGPYETDEIGKNGVAVSDILSAIAAKRPKIAILILDACRSLANPSKDIREIKRGDYSGSRLLPAENLSADTFVLYSASFGEQAVESFVDSPDKRANSLFTEVLRSELQRPGQTLAELGERVRLMVRAFASTAGYQQEPEYFTNLGASADFALVDSVGAERFPLSEKQCEGAQADWEQISQRPEREALERHRRRFPNCPTAELARRELVVLLNSSHAQATSRATNRPIDKCDQLAGWGPDPERPADSPGVALDDIKVDEAIAACKASIKLNPREPRFVFNLGRAEQAAANAMQPDDPQRAIHLANARAAFDDAQKAGSVAALFSLATLFDYSDAPLEDQEGASVMLKKAASQGFAPAMYELGLRYMNGSFGEERDDSQGFEWIAKAADSGLVDAMVEAGQDLWSSRGVDGSNPRRAIGLLQQAAEAGSTTAKRDLGLHYYYGKIVYDDKGQTSANSLLQDKSQALLWFGRAATDGDPVAEFNLAFMMDRGEGLPSPQPEIAERYYRLSAHGGDEDAELELAERLISGRVLSKPENGEDEALDLLNRALSQGSAEAALDLARVYRDGLLDVSKAPTKAMQFAYRAIKLSTLTDPTTPDGNPFYEIGAGILLAEMAVGGQAVDVNDRPLLTPDEVARLQQFYGEVDPDTHKVKIRRLDIPLDCGGYKIYRSLWVWDWGRAESPTEPQFRALERETECYNNDILRRTLSATYQTAKKEKVAFADLIEQQILAAKAAQNQKH